MTKHQPATPLPHRLRGDAKHGYIVGKKGEHVDEIPFEAWGDEAKALRQTWLYYIHAANAYPKLVEALKESIALTPPDSAFLESRVALLREIGEAS